MPEPIEEPTMLTPAQPPRDNIVRAVYPGAELRANEDEPGGAPILAGHFAVFDTWTEIDSVWEGRFLERIAPGAFAKTISENRKDIKVLFQHGMDPQVGDKPIASIDTLEEDGTGARYEAGLYDGIPPLIMSGLRAGDYGASFRFRSMREEFVTEPIKSRHNPDKLPERTIKEVRLFEFGPVTFPAYATATAGVRSMTDEFIFDRFRSKPERLRELIDFIQGPAPSDDAGLTPTSPERREEPPQPLDAAVPIPRRFRTREEFLEWISSI